MKANILTTFGYDAKFRNLIAPENALGITDFAMQLLARLRLHYHKYGDVELNFGSQVDISHLRFLLLIAWVGWS
jgi:hypothetical protein